MEAAVASASHEDRDQESEDLWSDLLALKKLRGLLRRIESEDVVPHGEIKDGLNEKARNLLKKLLDGATQQSLQRQQANFVDSEEQQHHPTTTQQESKLLLMIHNEDEGSLKELEFARQQHLQGECHQLHTMSGVDGPPPPSPKESLAISRTFSGTAAPEPQTELNRRPACDLQRLNSGGSTRNLLPDQNETKLQDPSPTRGQSHRRHHPIHCDHRVKSKEQSRRHRIHRDQSVKRSRQSHQLAAGTPPSSAATKSTQQRSKVEPAADCDPAQLKLVAIGESLAADARFKNDDLVPVTAQEPPGNEAVDLKLTESPNGGIEQNVAFDRTGKMFQASTVTEESEQVRRRKPSSHHSKRSNQSSTIMRRKQPSHSGTTESNHHHHHRHRASIRHVEQHNRMKKNGEEEFEGSHRRRKQPPRSSSRKTCNQSSMYSGSTATQSSSDHIESYRLSSRSHSLLRAKSHRMAREPSKSGRATSHNRRPSTGRVAQTNKKPSNSSLSRHYRRSEVPAEKTLKKQKEEQEGKLGRLKNKLSIIFHHHHNHHHHLHRSSEEKGVVVSAERRHRSLWEYLLGSTHCTSRMERKTSQHHQHGHLHALLERLIQHLFVFVKRKRRPTLRPHSRVKLQRQVGARTVHWWQRLRRRPIFGHVASKPRLQLGTGRRTK